MKMAFILKRAVGVIAVGLVIAAMPAFAAAQTVAADSDAAWRNLKPDLFGDKTIEDGKALLRLEIPERPQDAGQVPVGVTARRLQSSKWYVKTLTLIADHNPAPVAAVFHLSPRAGFANILTRIRIDQYSSVRAIAETNEGKLYMVSRFVKATGGCSAPAVAGSGVEALVALGKMRLRQHSPKPSAKLAGRQIAEISLTIRHPNHSGFQKDPVKGYFIPAQYVHKIAVSQNGLPILVVDGAISLSEDPTVRFDYIPQGDGEISVRAEDTDGHVFVHSWPLRQSLRQGS